MREKKLVVAALIIDQQGRVLLTQRTQKQSFAGYWEFPGGKIEEGESPEEALTREIQEEIGVACRVGKIAKVLFYQYPAFDLFLLVYHCEVLATPSSIEVEQIVYVERENLFKYKMIPADEPLVKELAAGFYLKSEE